MTRLGELWKFHNVHIYISILAHINSQTRKSLTISWKTKVQETQSCMSFACDRIQFCFKERHFSNAHDWQPQWAGLDCLPLLTNMLELCSRRTKVILTLLWYKQILGEMKANSNINSSYSTYWTIPLARQRARDFKTRCLELSQHIYSVWKSCYRGVSWKAREGEELGYLNIFLLAKHDSYCKSKNILFLVNR